MARWTPNQLTILSVLLDEVVGTKEMIEIRQDFCKIYDCLSSNYIKVNRHFTGSQSEGLKLPGSDLDFMTDINDWCRIKIIQSLDERTELFHYSVFFMSTENVPPGFVLLWHVNHANQTMMSPFLLFSTQNRNGIRYLSSDLMAAHYLKIRSKRQNLPFSFTQARQGPSVETWSQYCKKSESGMDDVLSIHCPFWPNVATEWTRRTRNFGWPKSNDISTIIDFGFHLVPVGHPHSDMKLMQWRISFSLAEKILVWSFNHVQMQCYALMKIILKEFIKVRCSTENQKLCSYFIKTFLFWKYETNELTFWCADNLRECIRYLLQEFMQCVREGALSHYFIPRFNLLSVKLTRAAQTELLQLFDIIIQSDISILKECQTLKSVWSNFLQCCENRNDVLHRITRQNLLRYDECLMECNYLMHYTKLTSMELSPDSIIRMFLALSCKTHLKTITLKRSLLLAY